MLTLVRDSGRLSFYEFFCGGGMARAGLGANWRCLFANDVDERKGEAYAANWGRSALRLADVADLQASDLPGRADLAWASFPCQDLSLAGAGAGLKGARSASFWGFHALMMGLVREARAPIVIAIENVLGLLTSAEGRDFAAVCGALQTAGYRFGALCLDAQHFTPQSRPRLFVVALRREISPPPALTDAGPRGHHMARGLIAAHASFPKSHGKDWLWWRLPEPPRRNLTLTDILDDDPPDAPWRPEQATRAIIAQLSRASRQALDEAKQSGERRVAALFRRTRLDKTGATVVRAEARFDGLAGCLRTPAGGSSRQMLLVVDKREVRTRLLSAREAARLMGLPDSYRLPEGATAAHHLLGDGVVAPVVRFLSEHLLTPLVAAASQARAPALADCA